MAVLMTSDGIVEQMQRLVAIAVRR